jgi:putative Holliday junction resolvase
MKRMPFLVLDIGSKYVGHAVFAGQSLVLKEGRRKTSTIATLTSEMKEETYYIQEVDSVLRAKNRALQTVLSLLETYGIDELVVGYPYQEEGMSQEQCEDIIKFCRRIRRRTLEGLPLSIHLVDEAFSSVEAEEALSIDSAQKRQQKKIAGAIDAQAAVIIGKRYLEGANQYKIQELLDETLVAQDTDEDPGE